MYLKTLHLTESTPFFLLNDDDEIVPGFPESVSSDEADELYFDDDAIEINYEEEKEDKSNE